MASYRKRGKGYQGTVYVGLRPDGTRINEYVTASTLKECKALARQLEDKLDAKTLSNMRNIRVVAWFDRYLETHKNTVEDNTYITYKGYVKNHFAPFFKSMKLGQVTELHIEDYINEKLTSLKSTTVRKHIMFMRMVFEKAKLKGIFDEIDMPTNAKFVPVLPTEEQFALIVADCKMKKKELIVLIAGYCGLRLGEIFALKWDDIDFQNRAIRVDESFSRTQDNDYQLKEPKSDNGYRTVPCPDLILKKLTEYKTNPYKSKRGFKNRNIVSLRIFDGRPDNFSNNFAKSMDKLGLSEIRFHDLRHYCASWLYRKQVPDHIAAEMLGHDIAVLKGIYQHLGLKDRHEHIERIRQLQNIASQNMTTNLTTKAF